MVEFVLRRRLGDTGVVARALVEGEGFIGWAACGRYTRRLGGQPEMVENGLDRGRLGDEGDEFHGVSTIWTHEREARIDACEQRRPQVTRRRARRRFVGVGHAGRGARAQRLGCGGQRLSRIGGEERAQACVAPYGHTGARMPW